MAARAKISRPRFGALPQWPYATAAYFGGKLTAAGLQVTEMEEWAGKTVFADVGAIVYYLTAVPWLVPGFSVATHLDALLALQEQVARGEELAFSTRLYLLAARKG